jgi:hypothetical protein
VVLGSGKPIFVEDGAPVRSKLVDAMTLKIGTIAKASEPNPDPKEEMA